MSFCCCTAECLVCTKYTFPLSHPTCTFSVLHACKPGLKLQQCVRSHSQVFRHVLLAGTSESVFILGLISFTQNLQDLGTLGAKIRIKSHLFKLDLSTCWNIFRAGSPKSSRKEFAPLLLKTLSGTLCMFLSDSFGFWYNKESPCSCPLYPLLQQWRPVPMWGRKGCPRVCGPRWLLQHGHR